jgi:hypothetical protein
LLQALHSLCGALVVRSLCLVAVENTSLDRPSSIL